MPSYLNPATTHQKLISLGLINNTELLPKTTAIIEDLQILIDEWLRWNAVVSEYSETLVTGIGGGCVTSNYPITELISVVPRLPGQLIAIAPTQYVWNGSVRTLSLGVRELPIIATYRAGLNPIPQIFALTMFNILRGCIANGVIDLDTSWLGDTRRSVKSVELPGGLKKSFNDSTGNPVVGDNGTELDKALAALTPYRRLLLAFN